MVKWSIKLSEFDISYQPRVVIKAQAITDFIVECIDTNQGLESDDGTSRDKISETWVVLVDGFSREQRARVGAILVSLEGEEVSYAIKFKFKATNNQAKYEAFIAGLKLVQALRAEKVKVRTNSHLVVNHLNESF